MTMDDLCQVEGCYNNVLFEVFWPGEEPKRVCPICAARAQNIGNAMGMPVPIRPLLFSDERDDPCPVTETAAN